MTTPTWLMVVPAIQRERTDRFLASLQVPHDQVLVVDNGRGRHGAAGGWDGRYHRRGWNLGVAASWNVGARAVLAEGLDWLLLASTSTVLGPSGGADLVAALDGCDNVGIHGRLGWHYIGVHRRAFEAVGLFDPGFWPAYFEETDFLYRLGLAGLPSPRENGQPWCWADLDGEFGPRAACITDGIISDGTPHLMELRYEAKWGGTQGYETFTTPWNSGHGLDWMGRDAR